MGDSGDHIRSGLLIFPVLLLLAQNMLLHMVKCDTHILKFRISHIPDFCSQIVVPDAVCPLFKKVQRLHNMFLQIPCKNLAHQQKYKDTDNSICPK